MSNPYVPQQSYAPSTIAGKPLTYAAAMVIDLGGEPIQEVALGGDLTLSARNQSANRKVDLIVRADGSTRTLTFDSDWVFVGTKPTQIAANKVGRLTFLSPGNTDAKVVCQWSVQT